MDVKIMDPFEEFEVILDKYILEECIPFVKAAWNEPHRKYHNIEHLKAILIDLKKCRFSFNVEEFEILVLGAFFHDVYYNTRNNLVNEDESIKRFVSSVTPMASVRIINYVVELINCTKYRKIPIEPIVKAFWNADNAGFLKGIEHLISNEQKIRDEYPHVPKTLYKKKRIEFIKSNFRLFGNKVKDDLQELIEYVNRIY